MLAMRNSRRIWVSGGFGGEKNWKRLGERSRYLYSRVVVLALHAGASSQRDHGVFLRCDL